MIRTNKIMTLTTILENVIRENPRFAILVVYDIYKGNQYNC